MTRKSQNRRQKDAAAAAANGGKLPNARVQREKSARCWYELKNVHARTVAYVNQLAQRMMQYANPIVLMKVAKNGDKERWDALNVTLQQRAGVAATDLEELWASHSDKTGLCHSVVELNQALKIFEAYQAFDMDFFATFSPIITELNEIFNKALKELLEAQDKLAAESVQNAQAKLLDPTVISDVNYAEVPAAPLPKPVEDLEQPVGGVAKAEAKVEVVTEEQASDLAVVGVETEENSAEEINVDPAMGHSLIRPNL